MSKVYELKNGKVTVYIQSGADRGGFNFEAVKVSTKPNMLFKYYVSSSSVKPAEGITAVDLGNYAVDLLKAQADKEFAEYIEEHINDTDFYTVKDEYNAHTFFAQLYYYKDEQPKVERQTNMDYSEIAEGILKGTVNGRYFRFDLVNDKFLSIRSSDYGRNAVDVSAMQVFYGQLNLRLAIEQYRRGLAHPAFTEIVNLSKWLDGKKSVKFIMANGSTHELKGDRAVYAGNIMKYIGGKFYLDDNYNLKPRFNLKYGEPPMELNELKSLQYAKQTYVINYANLVIEQPKAKTTKTTKSKKTAKKSQVAK